MFVPYEFKKKSCKDCKKKYMPTSGRQIRCVKCIEKQYKKMIKSGYFNAPRSRKKAAKNKETNKEFDY